MRSPRLTAARWPLATSEGACTRPGTLMRAPEPSGDVHAAQGGLGEAAESSGLWGKHARLGGAINE